jgi:putative hydrolase of the HAD superfamily
VTARAAILDYGGVMAASPVGRIHDLADQLGMDRGLVVETIFGGHGDGSANPWHDLEAGLCGFDDVFAARMQSRFDAHGVHFDLASFVSWVCDATNEPQPLVVETVRRARAAGIPTLLLTNSVTGFFPVIEATIPVDELFDHVLESWRIGVRKPAARAYEMAAETLGVAPQHCVFADDQEVNVAAARALGMTGIFVADDVEASLALASALGLEA